MNSHKLTEHIKAQAMALGFSLVGIAECIPLEEEFEHYLQWLQRGYHASMGYLDRNYEKRQDPAVILEGTRSVIVVAQNYYTPFQHDQNPEKGKISRYAWGDDYHEVIPPKLRALCDGIAGVAPEIQTKIYTDTGPVMEKQWAVRAGIGWQGKHSNIISRDIGSWFFLGVILTTAELEYDQPIVDYCGSCTACMEACPTQAIVENGVVDANKCISYWTIETKPHIELPGSIADNLEGWIFGCDICQDVCPWNRFQASTDEARFLPRYEETELDIGEVLSLEQEEFSMRFRKSPVKRTKIKGLQRNATVLSKNQKK